MNNSHAISHFTCTWLVALCLATGAFALAGCGSQEEQNAQPAQPAQATEEEQEQESITAHGSNYEKAETVSATTTLTGKTTAITVDEWLKNPSGLDVIDDVSTLQQIKASDDAITFTQDGEKLTWRTLGKDVHYSGITDKELPFSISYTYKLDGAEVDPATLTNVTGHLEIGISYQNNTQGSLSANGTSYSVQQPFAMASIVSLDAEHAKNVKVDHGQVMDQDGSFMAVGMAMPGLAKSLAVESMVSLPESVTIQADVTGFDMPSITTMASNQVLGMVGSETDEVSSNISDAFSQVDSIKQATDQLSQGTSAIDTALATIAEGQSKLNAAFPNATNGLTQLQQGSSGVGQLVEGANQALAGEAEAQQQMSTQIASLKEQLNSLKAVSTEGMADENIKALESAEKEMEATIANLEGTLAAAQQANGTAGGVLDKASEANAQVTSGLEAVAQGLTQIQSGYEQLAQATSQVSQAASQLSDGTKQMSEGVAQAIEEARGSIEGKFDLIKALSDYADEQGALCGNASNMPASTTYVVTAKA